MNNLEIIIQRKVGDTWPVVVEHHRPDALSPVRKEGILRLDEAELLKQSTPLDYGRVLGEALFRDADVRGAFDAARVQSQAEVTDLRLLLTVEDAELRTKRWERLCARIDGTWDLLALDRRIFFSHYLPSVADRLFRPIGRHALRALVVIASPAGLAEYRLDPFDVGPEVERVRAALGRIPCDVLASGEEPGPVAGAAGPATLGALCAQIEQAKAPYTLLHFMCHGLLSDDKMETRLLLAGEAGELHAVAGEALIEQLKRIGEGRGLPHFAFLAACSSAAPAAEGARGGLGQQLVRDLGMPAVVAMTDLVSIETAQGLARAFYPRLWAHGEVDRALVEATASLADRPDITVAALYGRLGGQPLFSERLDRAPTGEEMASGLDRLAALLQVRGPVLLRRFQDQAQVLQRSLAVDEKTLSDDQREERQQARDELNSLCREVLNLTFNGLAMGDEPGPYDARCPFPGLSPFGEDQQAFFFGRQALVGRLGERLAGHNFLALLGPSASGKSSLVQAGLISLLKEREPDLRVVTVMPGSDPAARLEALLPQGANLPGVLVVDPFEELFTECADEEKRRAFVERLLALSQELRLVVVMRADYLGDCAPYRGLLAEMEDHQELVRPLDGAELRRVVEQQAGAAGLRFDPGLVYAIMDAVQDQPGAMPLLQHGLQQLWQRRHGIWLRAEEYEALGGIREAIAGTADGVYDGLESEEEKARARELLMRLTRLDEDDAPAEDWRHARRRVAMADLVPAGRDPALTERLVARLEERHLLATRPNPVTGQTEVEVAHEALIEHWPRLRQWLARDREALRLREGVRRAAQEWADQAWAESYLVHRGARLARAEALAGASHLPLNAREQGYVEACVAYRVAGTLEEIQAAVAQNETAAAAYDRLRQDEGRALIRDLEAPGAAGAGWGAAPATLERVWSLLGLDHQEQPPPDSDGGAPFGPVARAAVDDHNRPATRRTAALALAATTGIGAMGRLEAAREAQAGRGCGRKAEMWGSVADADPGVEAMAGRLGTPDRVAIWLWRVGRRLARDRRRVGALAWSAAIGAGLGLGLWRGITAPWARLTWTLQLGMNIWWGGILGMVTGLALILSDYLLLSSGAEAGPERGGQERRATGLAVVLGTGAFGLAHGLIMLAGGTFSLSGKWLVLLAGFVAGLGLSLAFCDRPWKGRAFGRWPLRLVIVVVAFGLAQAIFVALGSSGAMSIVVSGEEYAGKLGAYGWWWWQGLSERNPDWVRVLGLIDSVMVGVVLFAGMALGFSRAMKRPGRDGSG